jgi:hypothetical protein
LYEGRKQKQYFTPYRGYLSSVQYGLHFGLGSVTGIDSVLVTWPDGKQQLLREVKADQEVKLEYSDAAPMKDFVEEQPSTAFKRADTIARLFTHQEDEFVDFKIQPLLPHMHTRNGPGLAVADINGDGLEDCFVGGATGQAGVFLIQQEDGGFQRSEMTESAYEDMGSLFFDADNDGDQDLYVVSGGGSFQQGDTLYRDRFFKNDGSGKFIRTDAFPELNVSGSVVAAADYNKDGFLDLFVGGRVRPGEYPLAPESVLLKNKGRHGEVRFEKDPQHGFLTNLGMVTAALWTDFNNDTWPDLIVAGEFTPIRIFLNKSGVLKEISETTGLRHTNGWWNSIAAGDFDEDGDMDYILGNLGLNSRYKASPEEPLCIYAKDYDKNGQIDPVMCYYIDGENYVAHSRNDLIEQINAMRGRFRTYSDYAKATFEESFMKEELTDAYVVKSEIFANSYLNNLGNGKFELSALPRIAQIAPMYGMLVGDYNGDRHLDLLSVGNFYSGEVFSGQYDASIGWLLAGDGDGGFVPIDVRESGFFVPGDAKGLVSLWNGDRQLILASINNGPLVGHTFPRNKEMRYEAKPGDVAALVRYPDQSIQRFEFYYGSGYLSQTSRTLAIPAGASSVIILDKEGRETEILSLP